MSSSAAEIYTIKLDQLRQAYAVHPQLAAFADDLLTYARPAVTFRHSKEDADEIGVSRYGGVPDLPPDYPYPVMNGVPLIFLAQLRMDELVWCDVTGLLPTTGLLLFFLPDRYHTNHSLDGGLVLFFEDCSQLEPSQQQQPMFTEYRITQFDTVVSLPEQFSIISRAVFRVSSPTSPGYLETIDPYWRDLINRDTGCILGYPRSVHGWVLDTAVQKYYAAPGIADLQPEQTQQFYRLFQGTVPQALENSWDGNWTFFYTIHHQHLVERRFEHTFFAPEHG